MGLTRVTRYPSGSRKIRKALDSYCSYRSVTKMCLRLIGEEFTTENTEDTEGEGKLTKACLYRYPNGVSSSSPGLRRGTRRYPGSLRSSSLPQRGFVPLELSGRTERVETPLGIEIMNVSFPG